MQSVETLMPRNAILGEVTLRPANSKEALKEQTDNFEAIVLKQMLDISMPEENTLFGEAREARFTARCITKSWVKHWRAVLATASYYSSF